VTTIAKPKSNCVVFVFGFILFLHWMHRLLRQSWW